LADGTYRTYAYNLMRAKRVSANLDIFVLTEYFDKVKPDQARNMLTSLVVYDGPRWKKLHERYIGLVENRRFQQSLSDRESAQWANWPALKGMVRRLKADVKTHGLMTKRTLNKAQRNMLLGYICWSVHMELPMRNDLCTVRLARVPGDVGTRHNWYVVSNGTFMFRTFKTSKFFLRRGWIPLKLPVSTGLAVTIRKYLRGATQHDNEYLLEMAGGRRYTKSGFANLYKYAPKRYLDKQIGTSMTRHIFLSWFLSRDPSLVQRQAVMKKMMQSRLLTQEIYRRRDVP
jgi:hypothetical protein